MNKGRLTISAPVPTAFTKLREALSSVSLYGVFDSNKVRFRILVNGTEYDMYDSDGIVIEASAPGTYPLMNGTGIQIKPYIVTPSGSPSIDFEVHGDHYENGA